jgi:sterol desaturase/sphingolipid hydroxylase (fatty acid hydroxylase superfamily)/protein-tyrosine-phosphatase
MDAPLLSSEPIPLDSLLLIKRVVPVALLTVFWSWETWQPFFGTKEERLRHAARNLALAVVNTVALALAFGWVTVFVAQWAENHRYGLLHLFNLAWPIRLVLGLLLLDGWMYVWHRANHEIPVLWRFHRMHHTDNHMDVTTATRFHLGEHVGSSVLRLGLIPLVGFEVWTLVIYDTLVLAVTQFHHADISIGRWDRWLNWLIVTPNMHKVHHSDWQPETDSNYSTVFSWWDRLARTLQRRADPKTIRFGLNEFSDPAWQRWWALWKTPFVNPKADPPQHESATTRKRVVFICVENSNRSQMAEAFARMFGAGKVEAYSAGVQPSGRVHPKAIEAMRERGYDLTRHRSKGMSELPDQEFDFAALMGCEEWPNLRARSREIWNMPCPKEMPPDQFRAVRDQIEERVKEVLASFDPVLQESH